jgi:hypothetical protein
VVYTDTTKHAATQDIAQLTADAAADSYTDTMQATSSNRDHMSAATTASITVNDDNITQTTPSRRRRRKHRQSTPTNMTSAGSNLSEKQQDEQHVISITTAKPLGALRLKPLQQQLQQQPQPVVVVLDHPESQSLRPSG